MLKAINSYKKEVNFGFLFMVCAICVVLTIIQFATMHGLQNDEITWQGSCVAGALDGSSENIKMTVKCLGQEEFQTTDKAIISYAMNENRIFNCVIVKGNIMKNEWWNCIVPGKE